MKDTSELAPGETGAAQTYRLEIDGLRALAVVSVFVFHLYPDACPGGFVGVDVFFVISGYLISRIVMMEATAGKFTFLGFYERRVRRIAPALIGMLLGTSVGAAVLLPPQEYVSFANSARAATLSVSNFFFWRHSAYFELGSNSLPLLHTWSLAVEEQFYLIFPAIFVIGRRLGLSWPVIIVPLLALSLTICIDQTPTDATAAFYSPLTRAWEFLTGALIVIAPSPSRRGAEVLAAAGLLLLAASFFVIDDGAPFPGWRALLPCVGSASLIWGGRAGVAAPLRSLLPVAIGRLSYSLYLWHWPVIVAARTFWGGRFTLAEAATVAVVALALAWCSWRFVEEPTRRWRAIFTRGRLFAGAAAAVLLNVGACALIDAQNGFPGRYSAAATAFLDSPTPRPLFGCDAALDACKTSASGAPEFAVLGDSMALPLQPAIDAAARAHGAGGYDYFAKGGCFPLVGVGSPTCREFVDSSIRRIAAEPSVRVVLLVGRWPTIVEPRRFGRQNARTVPLPPAETVAAFGRTRTALGARRLFVLTSIPEQPVDVPTAEADRVNLGLSPFLGVTRSAFERRVQRTDQILAQVTSPGERLDASKLLCGSSVCIATLAGRSLYADDNHLSFVGADYLERRGFFEPLFATLSLPSNSMACRRLCCRRRPWALGAG